MKFLLSLIFAFIFLSTGSEVFSQEECKVLKPEIADKYSGDCKNGLANGKGLAEGIDKYQGKFKNGLPDGKGKYTWSNGDTWDGRWDEGKRNGEGVYRYRKDGGDSILNGIWDNDVFVKRILPPPYKVYGMRDLDKYTLTKIKDGDRVLLKLRQIGLQNIDVKDFSFFADNGTYQQVGNTYVYSNVMFPVQIKISYITKNKMKTVDINPMLEVIINEPGEWEIMLYN